MRKAKLASVQQHYVRAREILDGTLCLWSPASPTKRSYRAILEIVPINVLLKSTEEQDALTARYQALLKALAFPVEILIRHQRLDLDPYLARMRERIPPMLQGSWPQLATEVAQLLQRLGSRRTLIERRCYLIIPAPEPFLQGVLHRKRTRRNVAARAMQELDVRVETLRRQLLALGLQSQRLRGEEIAHLVRHCLMPEHAGKHPLAQAHLASVGHLPRWERKTANLAPMLAQAQTKAEIAQIETVPHDPTSPARTPHQRGLRSRGHGQPGQRADRRPSARRENGSAPSSRSRSSAPRVSALPPPDGLRLADLLAPSSVEEFPQALRLGEQDWVRGVAVTAFPREVAPGWLAPLLMHDDLFDLVFHLHPQNQGMSMRQLQRRRAGYRSAQAFQRRQGRQDDPETSVAQNDVERTINRLVTTL